MAYNVVQTVTLTTVEAGSCTAYTTNVINADVKAVVFDVGTLTTPTVTVTGDKSGISIITKVSMASGTYYPRGTAVAPGLTDLTYDGTYKVPVLIPLANEKIKVVVSGGGSVLAGSIKFITG